MQTNANANTEVLSVTFIHSVFNHEVFSIPTGTVKGQLHTLYPDNSNLNMPGQASGAEVKWHRVHTIRFSQRLK